MLFKNKFDIWLIYLINYEKQLYPQWLNST